MTGTEPVDPGSAEEPKGRVAEIAANLGLVGRALTVTIGVLAGAGHSSGAFFRILGVGVAALVSVLELAGQARSRRVLLVASGVSVAALIVGLAVGGPQRPRPVVPTDLAIGLLPFDATGPSEGAIRLRSSLLEEASPTSNRSGSVLTTAVRAIDERPPDDHGSSGLADVAQRFGVSAVIGGALGADELGRSTGTFFVSLSSDVIRDAPELGPELAVPPIRVDGDIEQGGEPLRQMRAHVERTIRQVVLVLDAAEQTRARRYDVAAQRITDALELTGDATPMSADVLHVLLGNTYLARTTARRSDADIGAATAAFTAVDPDGAERFRRDVGLAEIAYFKLAGSGCRAGLDLVSLGAVVRDLSAVFQSTRSEPTATRTAGKAAIGAVRASVCEALAGGRQQVSQELAMLDQWLSTAGTAVEVDLRSLARSWQAIGLRTAGDPGAGATLLDALSTASDPALAGRWWLILAGWRTEDCDPAGARAAIERSRQEFALSPDEALQGEGERSIRRAEEELGARRCA